jgi:hypothetical protein
LPLAPEAKKQKREFMLSPVVIEELEIAAKRNNWSKSYIVELALRQLLGLYGDEAKASPLHVEQRRSSTPPQKHSIVWQRIDATID